MGVIGRHLLSDLYGIEPERLQDAERLATCLEAAARRCGLTPLGPPTMHGFPGGGVTGVILLAESHIALHTYPERGFLALDVFSCGEADPQAALAVFREALLPLREEITLVERGSMDGLQGLRAAGASPPGSCPPVSPGERGPGETA